jgi:hypothetical protein
VAGGRVVAGAAVVVVAGVGAGVTRTANERDDATSPAVVVSVTVTVYVRAGVDVKVRIVTEADQSPLTPHPAGSMLTSPNSGGAFTLRQPTLSLEPLTAAVLASPACMLDGPRMDVMVAFAGRVPKRRQSKSPLATATRPVFLPILL